MFLCGAGNSLGISPPNLGARQDPISRLDFVQKAEPFLPLFACLWLSLFFLSPKGVRACLWEEDRSAKEGLLFIFVSLRGYPL